jgi:hypothetical protein
MTMITLTKEETRIRNALNALDELRCATILLGLNKQAAIDLVITADIKREIEAIEAEFAEGIETGNARIANLEDDIKRLTMEHGASVRGARLQAVWSKPRVSWDTKALDGYAAAHAEILPFRTVGQPSVSIRSVA